MKLTWRDIITTLVGLVGGAVVYAKINEYSWALIASWRSSVAVLALVALVMFAFSGFSFANRSILNVAEIFAGVVMGLLALVGMFVTSSFLFYSLAIVMGAIWLVDTARHARHSMIEGSTTLHPHAPIH